MKRKNLFYILVLLSSISALGQKPTLTLTFTADNSGQHVPIDSVLIENLTQGGDTTLHAPDTTLILDYITGIHDTDIAESSFFISQNYPNPFIGQTTLNLYLPESEYLYITIRDIMGRELIQYENTFNQGGHTIIFYGGNEMYYLLTVNGKKTSHTVKMINMDNKTVQAAKCRLVYNEQGNGIGYKSQKSVNEFVFNLGNELKYTSFSELGERYMIDSPIIDTNYIFHYHGNSCPETPTVTDIDGNVYNTALIGSQCWMAENLKTTTYSNETPIPNVTANSEWSNLTTGAYVWYSNNISLKNAYGALYNWYAVIDTNGLCPTGWHVPSDDEWTTLTDYIGGTAAPFGNELKSCKQVNSPLGGDCNVASHPRWAQHNTHYGTNDHWFSGLPGGTRNFSGTFVTVGYIGSFWSSTEGSSTYGVLRGLNYNDGEVQVFGFYKQNGYSVRCLKD